MMNFWDKQPDELAAAYRGARLYFEAGPGRSLAAVEEALRPPTGIGSGSDRDQTGPRKPSGTLRSWCARQHWFERAEAFDRHFDRIFEAARASEAINQATLLEQRRTKLAETEWIVSQAILRRITEMLAWPISETRTEERPEDGQTARVTIISPAKWRLGDIAALGRFATDLQRRTVGMPTRIAVQPISPSGDGNSTPVDQMQADADNGRITAALAEYFLEKAARMALDHVGLVDAQLE